MLLCMAEVLNLPEKSALLEIQAIKTEKSLTNVEQKYFSDTQITQIFFKIYFFKLIYLQKRTYHIKNLHKYKK